MTVAESREERFRVLLRLWGNLFTLLQRFNRGENVDPVKLCRVLRRVSFLMQDLTQALNRDLDNPAVTPKTHRHRVRFTKYDRGILGSFGIAV